MDKKKVLGYSVFIVVLALVFLCAAEIIARKSLGIRSFKKSNSWLQTLMVHDPLLGWRNRPSSRAMVTGVGRDIYYEINSRGLRSPEYAYEKPQGMRRVLFLGDSCTYGWGVPEDERFSDLFAKYFAGVEAVNAGVQGYGLDQMLIYLKEEGIKYHPDLVVVYLIPDDVSRMYYSKMWDRLKPLFLLAGDGSLRLTNVPVPDMMHPVFWNPILDRIENFLLRKSYFFWYVCIRLNNYFEHHAPRTLVIRERAALTTAVLKELGGFCRDHGIKLLVVGGLNQSQADSATRLGIPYLEDPLNQYSPKQWWLSNYDHHPNPFGHQVIAKGIAQYLEKERLFTNEQ